MVKKIYDRPHGLQKYKKEKCRCRICLSACAEDTRRRRRADPERYAESQRRYVEKKRKMAAGEPVEPYYVMAPQVADALDIARMITQRPALNFDTAQAACRDHDTELWFSNELVNISAAKRICAECPVRMACLDYATNAREKVGVWGGLDEAERARRLRRIQREARREQAVA